MPLQVNTVDMTSLQVNGTDMNIFQVDGVVKWRRPFTYTRGSLPTGVASISAEINYSVELYSERVLATSDTIYFGEYIDITASPSTGYSSPTINTGSFPNPISANVTGANYVTAGSALSYTFTIPVITGVGTQTLNRTSSPYKGASTGVIFNAVGSGSYITVYYGDVIAITASPASGYNNPTISGSPVTISGNVTTSSYITAGSAATQNVTITGYSNWMDGPTYTTGTRTCTSTFVATAATFVGKRKTTTASVGYWIEKGGTTVKSGSASSFTMTSGELSSISGAGTITVECTTEASQLYWFSAALTVTYAGT